MRVWIVSAKIPKPAEVVAEAEMNPEWVVDKGADEYQLQPGDQLQW